MNKSILEIRLPDGREIFYLNVEEVEFLYDRMPNYLQHGVVLKEGDTVFDVGANIGMFSLMCSKLCNNNVNIYAFEPIPAIYNVLQRNIKRHNSEGVRSFNYGLSNTNKDLVKFQYYPKASGFSTMYHNEPKAFRESVGSIMLQNVDELPPSTKKNLTKVPNFLRSSTLNLKLRKALKSQIVNGKTKTISQVISDRSVEKIDLLKIDVEKSEYDVLLGIQEPDWSIIKQIVIEAHNIDNRVDSIKALLLNYGFVNIVAEQEKILKRTEYYNIYATRK